LIENDIKQFVRSKKFIGYSRTDIYQAALNDYGKDNENLIMCAISDEFNNPSLNKNLGYTANSNSLATTTLVCGILSIFFFGIILGPIAIYFGIKAKDQNPTSGSATAGIICGVIGLIGAIIIILAMCGSNYLY